VTVPAHDPTTLINAARVWYDAGFCVIPSHEDGSKRPFGAWKQYQQQRPGWEKLHGWLSCGRYTGIGCIMGKASGNAEMIEIEGPAKEMALRLNAVIEHAKKYGDDSGVEKLLTDVVQGFLEVSAGGGLHTIIRISDGTALGNTKLAHDGDKVIAETRGEGGFVIVYPTPARTGHDPDAAYVLEQGSPATVVTVTSDERDMLHQVFQFALDNPAPVIEQPAAPVNTLTAPRAELTPFDDYRARTTWRDILEPAGWTWHSTDNQHDYWVRPGKDPRDGHSASTIEDGPFYLFSSSVEGIPREVGLSKAQVFAHLHHGGDLSAATRALREQGYGDEYEASGLTLTEFIHSATTRQEVDRERTSWWPRDLAGVIEGHETEPEPTHLTRGDGPAMFYSGRVNGLIGESESGKTWVALHATAQQLTQAQPVVYLDFEDSAPGIVNRLRTLGCNDQHLAHLTYIAPDETLSTSAKQDLAETLITAGAGLVIVDGFNAAMTLMGLDINSNNDATTFAQQLLKPIAATGACVVYVDHVPKSKEARGKGGIGAQAKRAMTTGCALTVTVTEPFGQGQAGRLHLTVDKDRPGKVRAHSYAAKHAGDVILTPEGRDMRITIQPSDKGADTTAQDEAALVELLKIIEDNPGITQTQIEGIAKGGAQRLRGRLEYLVHLGKLQVVSGSRGAKQFHFVEHWETPSVFEVAAVNE
jgi:hypothetical protein